MSVCFNTDTSCFGGDLTKAAVTVFCVGILTDVWHLDWQ